MDIGSGVALGTLGLSAAIVIIKYGPKPKSGSCTLHQGIVERLQAGDKNFMELCADQKFTKRLVMAIAGKMDIKVSDIKSELQDVIGGEH